MKILSFIAALIFTGGLVYVLNTKMGKVPPMGKFLSPQHGFWQNGESKTEMRDKNLHFSNLKGKATVYVDDRLVPHVFAEFDEDAYFIQGYLHAKYRLWQMEFQTMAAAGRLSEIIGKKALNFDREQRRLGMVYAAKNSVKEAEKDPLTKMSIDQYTAGINSYIGHLTAASLPFEYKLLDYSPETWSPLKTALLLKYMSKDLAGYEDDFERANARTIFTREMYESVYEYGNDSLKPIIDGITPKKGGEYPITVPANTDSVYFTFKKGEQNNISSKKPDKDNGSNNWAVAGSKTKSGKPILCNDPHLGLNLPSLWFEMQIHTPSYNAYGASLPGAPGIVIGFNDSCAFGFTNAMRDVRDYYEIRFKDDSKKEYWFNNQWQPATITYDTIGIRDGKSFVDTIAYVKEFGPVMYDKSFTGTGKSGKDAVRSDGKYYAVRWKAHDPSNEMRTFLMLNRAKNFADYADAISTYGCPGQNMIFAAHSGDIAIKQQGEFPAKWYRQGDFPMPGTDSSYAWKGNIPASENYMMHNPQRGFVSSANQYPYDTKTYPYYLGGNYPFTRGWNINRQLGGMNGITPQDMQQLQNNNENTFARMMRPILLRFVDEATLTTDAKKYLALFKQWNGKNDIQETGATIFAVWKTNLKTFIWDDEMSQLKNYVMPEESTLLDGLLRDTAWAMIDNITTKDHKETLREAITNALNKAAVSLKETETAGNLNWGKYKGSMIKHLLDINRDMALSRFDLPIGGGEHVINATKKDHGPSWKMIVHLADETEAYGVYPGGQSGNPGSKFYDSFIDTWANGKYYTLWMMKETQKDDKRVLFHLQFSK
jgi:penicillin G amidase